MLRGAGDGGSPVKCDELYSVSHQALRTCANPFLKGFMCLKQETSENHSNMYVLSANTQRTEIRTRGNGASQLLEEPPISPPPTDVGVTWPPKPCTRATDDWPGSSQSSPGGRQPKGKLAAVPPGWAATAADRSLLTLTLAELTHSISSDQRYLKLLF